MTTEQIPDTNQWSFVLPNYDVKVTGVIVEGEKYAVSVVKTGEGTVTLDADQAKAGEKVTITATPAEGYVTDGPVVKKSEDAAVAVSKDPTKANTWTFVMPAEPVSVTVAFTASTAPLYEIKVIDVEGGTITANATQAKASDTVTLTAVADAGYEFTSWTLTSGATATDASAASTTFTMPAAAVTVTTTFTKKDFTVSGPNSVENGTVTGVPATAKMGEEVTITATPTEGYEATVEVKDSKNAAIAVTKGADNEYTFTMPADDVTVTVTFALSDTVAEKILNGISLKPGRIWGAYDAEGNAVPDTGNFSGLYTQGTYSIDAGTMTKGDDGWKLDTVVRAKGIVSHKNGGQMDGWWTGVCIELGDTIKSVKIVRDGDNKTLTDGNTGSAVQYEDTATGKAVNTDRGFGFYVNAEEPVTRSYTVTLTGKDGETVTFKWTVDFQTEKAAAEKN